MNKSIFRATCICLIIMLADVWVYAQSGPVAQWNFDEGQGTIAYDSSGNGYNATLSGASWVSQGSGYALSLDGLDDYAESANPGITDPITIETWIKPLRKANGLSCIAGVDLHTFLLSYYNTEVCDFFIGAGSNFARSKVKFGEWNHIVASFDGTNMMMWVNGQQTANKVSSYTSYTPPAAFIIGTKNQPDLPRFKGLLDTFRVYDRGLTANEAIAHFKAEAVDHDFDSYALDHIIIKPYYYPDRMEMVLDASYLFQMPFSNGGKIDATLVNNSNPSVQICSNTVQPLSATGCTDVVLSCGTLPEGDYTIHVILSDNGTTITSEDISYTCTAYPRFVPYPSTEVVGALPNDPALASFGFTMRNGGGFDVSVNGVTYPFKSRISWPEGDYNQLSATDTPYTGGESTWTVSVNSQGNGVYTVNAGGNSYSIAREVSVQSTHIYVKDTYTNNTSNDIGLLIYNETPVVASQLTQTLLSGHERLGRPIQVSYPDYGPSTFFVDSNTGMGIIPIDDVFVVQALPYVSWSSAAGVGTEKFALGPGQSYTLEWAVYPTPSKNYYDFINAFRTAEDRIASITQTPGYITGTLYPPLRRQVPTQTFMDKRNLDIGLIHNLWQLADDPYLGAEGIEFRDFPLEMDLMKQMATDTHAAYPGLQIGFHIAHSLYCTNNENLFPDSKVISSNGVHSTWGDGSAFGPVRQAEGWRWWIFYPTPGNSFHTALIQSPDIFMDQMGFDGAFMDGFNVGYGGHWSYDTNVRWDGHSAEINTTTKTITRKMNSVILLSQPSLIEFARKVRDKGGFIVANNNVYTRSLTNEKYIIFDAECVSGPQLHLAPSVTALNGFLQPGRQKDYYLDMLDKLSWGELYISYSNGNLAYPSLNTREFPMTFREIRSGMVKGDERIVTMNSGVYGWTGNKNLHMVYKFDDRGAPIPHNILTTGDSTGVRTELNLGEDESAVIESIPVTILTESPVNMRVDQYDENGVKMSLNGQGRVTLQVRNGSFPVGVNLAYTVNTGTDRVLTVDENGNLSIPLELDGPMEVTIPTNGVLGGAQDFFATQGTGGGQDLTRIYDSKMNVVKFIAHFGRALTFDTDGSLYIGESLQQTDGSYIIWRCQYLGNSQWADGVEYARAVALPLALTVDPATRVLYIGLVNNSIGNSDIYKVSEQGATPVWYAQGDPGRNTQDMEIGPDGKLWIGGYFGYTRYPLTGGYWADKEVNIPNGYKCGGLAFADVNRDGTLELLAAANNVYTDIGYYSPYTGALLGTCLSDSTIVNNYCMAVGPDINGNGSRDIFVLNYYCGFKWYDGTTKQLLGEVLGLNNGGALASYSIASCRVPVEGAVSGLQGFFATQGTGGQDLTRIYDSKMNVVKFIAHFGYALTFDTAGNLYIGESLQQTDGSYIIWRCQYLGNSQWADSVEYARTIARPLALTVDPATRVLYIGLANNSIGNSDIYKVNEQGATPVWYARGDTSRNTQDMEIGPDGKLWIGGYFGYIRYPFTGGYWADKEVYIPMKGGGFAFKDVNDDGTCEMLATNSVWTDIGYYDPYTGTLLGTFLSDPAIVNNYCMCLGPDMNGNGSRDIFVANYYCGFKWYDGTTKQLLGEVLGLNNGGTLATISIAACMVPADPE